MIDSTIFIKNFLSLDILFQQRNFKQKIVALLKRFKVPEEMDGGVPRQTLRGERELDALFHELDSLSCCEGDDSGPDMDSLSVGSTPKPSLRPFFTNSKNMLHENLMGLFFYCLSICSTFHYFDILYLQFLFFLFG